uniref:Peptidase M23 domain-containing protein n=1 Tax=Astyanax mexicanus TaxID=7994 RepID=A0A8B9JWL8_ASTMX
SLPVTQSVGLFAVCLFVAAKFNRLCSTNPKNSARSCDRFGCGHYGAKRVNGKHRGLDITCSDWAKVYAPFDLILRGRSRPYGNKNIINDGVTIRGQDLCVRLFYIRPVRFSGWVRKGQRLGIMLPMQKIYPGITSHIHLQMCDWSDPTKYV